MAKGTHTYHLDKYTAYWWISWGVNLFPKSLAYFMGNFVPDLLFKFSNSGSVIEEQVRNFGHILGPGVSVKERRKAVRRLWKMLGRSLVDMFRFEKMSASEIDALVPEFVGLEHIRGALEKGKGAIILTAHLGHWELGGILLDHLGFKLNIVQYLYDSEQQNKILDKNKEIRGIRVIPADDQVGFAIAVHGALKRNELVAIQGDRDLDKSGVVVDFFGSPASFPKGPALLAMKTGVPLVPAFTIMGGDGRYYPVAEPEVELANTGDTAADLKVNVGKVAGIIEKYVRKYPEQWFNFYYFWE